MRTDDEARRQIVEIANDLFAMGQLTPTGGNISARAADDDKIWITPSQLYKGSLTVDWPDAAVLTAGQIAGSWLSAQVARRMPASAVRAFVIAVGCAMAASFFLRGR